METMSKGFILGIILTLISLIWDVWGGGEITMKTLIFLTLFGICLILFVYFYKKERKENEDKEKLVEKINRPKIRFNIKTIDEIGDYVVKSNLVIKNIRPENKALDFRIKIIHEKKIITECDLNIPINNEFIFKIQKEFAKPGKYFIFLWFKSELNYRYRLETMINCVEEDPLKFWSIDRTHNTSWIKRGKFKNSLEEEEKWPNSSKK